MADDFSYLEGDNSVAEQLLKDVEAQVELLKELEVGIEKMEQHLKDRKQELFDRKQSLARRILACGFHELHTLDGRVVEVVQKVHCSPNKMCREEQFEFLRGNGGEFLIKQTGVIDGADIAKCNVPVKVEEGFNTSSLKAYLTNLLGLKGGTPLVEYAEVPKSFNLFVENEVVVR